MSTATDNFTRTDARLPPEGVLVDTISANGVAQPLKRRGGLWFIEDDSMYVYYEVKYWRARS